MTAPTWPCIEALSIAIRQQSADSSLRANPAGFLQGLGVSSADADAMLKHGAERILLYRRLVHNRLRRATREFIPRTVARLGKARFRMDFARFVEDHAIATPYLRVVPETFVAWVVEPWRNDPAVPAYLIDLAHHELLSETVKHDWRGGEPPTGLPLALEYPLRFDGAARLLHYAYPVHRLPLDIDDRTEPVADPIALLVYRDRTDDVRYLELDPFAAATVQALMVEHLPVAQGLRRACESLDTPLDDERLATAAQLLADLADRGVMLGANPV